MRFVNAEFRLKRFDHWYEHLRLDLHAVDQGQLRSVTLHGVNSLLS